MPGKGVDLKPQIKGAMYTTGSKCMSKNAFLWNTISFSSLTLLSASYVVSVFGFRTLPTH